MQTFYLSVCSFFLTESSRELSLQAVIFLYNASQIVGKGLISGHGSASGLDSVPGRCRCVRSNVTKGNIFINDIAEPTF